MDGYRVFSFSSPRIGMESTLVPNDAAAPPTRPPTSPEGIVVFGLVLAVMVVARLVTCFLNGSQGRIQTITLCPPHKWFRTDPQAGALTVLKCARCPVIIGPTDEWGRPNKEYQ